MLRWKEGSFPCSGLVPAPDWPVPLEVGHRCTWGQCPWELATEWVSKGHWPVTVESSPALFALGLILMLQWVFDGAWMWLVVRFAEAEHRKRMLPWDQLCWHLWGGQTGCCLLFPAHTQGALCTKWHQGSLFSSDATFVTCYQVNCDKIDWSSPESDTVCWDGCCVHRRQVQSFTGLLPSAS